MGSTQIPLSQLFHPDVCGWVDVCRAEFTTKLASRWCVLSKRIVYVCKRNPIPDVGPRVFFRGASVEDVSILRPHAIKVSGVDRSGVATTLYLCAKDEEEQRRWLGAIGSCIRAAGASDHGAKAESVQEAMQEDDLLERLRDLCDAEDRRYNENARNVPLSDAQRINEEEKENMRPRVFGTMLLREGQEWKSKFVAVHATQLHVFDREPIAMILDQYPVLMADVYSESIGASSSENVRFDIFVSISGEARVLQLRPPGGPPSEDWYSRIKAAAPPVDARRTDVLPWEPDLDGVGDSAADSEIEAELGKKQTDLVETSGARRGVKLLCNVHVHVIESRALVLTPHGHAPSSRGGAGRSSSNKTPSMAVRCFASAFSRRQASKTITVKGEGIDVVSWDQHFFFNVKVNETDIENGNIVVGMYDASAPAPDHEIGRFAFSTSQLYYATPGHSLSRQWVALAPQYEDESVRGYLLVSVSLLGAGDVAPVYRHIDIDAKERDMALRCHEDIALYAGEATAQPHQDVRLVVHRSEGLAEFDVSSRMVLLMEFEDEEEFAKNSALESIQETHQGALDSEESLAECTIRGAPARVKTGRFGRAAMFRNAHDAIVVHAKGDASDSTARGFELGSAWSVSCWFKCPLPDTKAIHALLYGLQNDYHVAVHQNQDDLGCIDNTGGTGFHASGVRMSELRAGWHHLCVTAFDGRQLFYIDSRLAGEVALYQCTNDLWTIANTHVGGHAWGMMDEFRLFRRRLLPTEVFYLFVGRAEVYACLSSFGAVPGISQQYSIKGGQQYDEELRVGVPVPPLDPGVVMSIREKGEADTSQDRVIGEVTFPLHTLPRQKPPPRWYPLYGEIEIGQLEYRKPGFTGRVLLSADVPAASLRKRRTLMQETVRADPVAIPESAKYILLAAFDRAVGIHGCEPGDQAYVEVAVGNRKLFSDVVRVGQDTSAIKFSARVVELKLRLPADVVSHPDIFLYVMFEGVGHGGRLALGGFARLHASSFANPDATPLWVPLRDPRTRDLAHDSKHAGAVLCAMALVHARDANTSVAHIAQRFRELRKLDEERAAESDSPVRSRVVVHVYQARLEPGPSGDPLDCVCTASCGGAEAVSKTAMFTRFPVWNEALVLENAFGVGDDVAASPHVALSISDVQGRSPAACIGSAWITLDKLTSPRPAWYGVHDNKGTFIGAILASAAVGREASTEPPQPVSKFVTVHTSALGLRAALQRVYRALEAPVLEVVPEVHGMQGPMGRAFCATAPSPRVGPREADFIEEVAIDVELPLDPLFEPVIVLRVHDTRHDGAYRPLVGAVAVRASSFCEWLRGASEEETFAEALTGVAAQYGLADSPAEQEAAQHAENPILADLATGGDAEAGRRVLDYARGELDRFLKDEPFFTYQLSGVPTLSALDSNGGSSAGARLTPGCNVLDPDEHAALVGAASSAGANTANALGHALSVLPTTPAETAARAHAPIVTGDVRVRLVVTERDDTIPPRERFLGARGEQRRAVARIYVLGGHRIAWGHGPASRHHYSEDDHELLADARQEPDTYLMLRYGSGAHDYIRDMDVLQVRSSYPQYYKCYTIPLEFPRHSDLRIEVVRWASTSRDSSLGSTTINMFNRILSEEWRRLRVKPVEFRTLRTPSTDVHQGKLECFLELFDAEDVALLPPPERIAPPQPEPFEVRVVLWSAMLTAVMRHHGLSTVDAIASIGLEDIPETYQRTDVHWSAEAFSPASFHWRAKMSVELPLITRARLHVLVWDRDVLQASKRRERKQRTFGAMRKLRYARGEGSDESDREGVIAEGFIDIHPLIHMARRRRTSMSWGRIRCPVHAVTQKTSIKSSMWDDLLNAEPEDYVELSLDVLTAADAKSKSAGFGRSFPNRHPWISPPNRSLSPLALGKQFSEKVLRKVTWGRVNLFISIILSIAVIVLAYMQATHEINFLTPSAVTHKKK